ncbi:MAG: hypothetical protein AAGF83_18675 [Cyanobacteria bacterium P01_G01_bin.67]
MSIIDKRDKLEKLQAANLKLFKEKNVKPAEFFLDASLEDLYQATSIKKSRWSLYFNKKKNMSEETIEDIGFALGISAIEAFTLISQRREMMIDKRRKKR